jgi:predicted nucleic acid-binding protein
MSMSIGRVFCDTNIVLRFTIREMPEHTLMRAAVGRLLAGDAELWISRQVIREFCAVLTRPQTFAVPLSGAAVVAFARSLPTSFRIADETAEVTTALLALLDAIPCGGKQVHDANIVATMQA